jgi:hypothetical protein
MGRPPLKNKHELVELEKLDDGLRESKLFLISQYGMKKMK